MSQYRVQIVNAKDEMVVQWRPGHLIEAEIGSGLADRLRKRAIPDPLRLPASDVLAAIVRAHSSGLLRSLPSSAELTERVRARGVGAFVTEASVIQAVKEEYEALIGRVTVDESRVIGAIREEIQGIVGQVAAGDRYVSENEILHAIEEEFALLLRELKQRV